MVDNASRPERLFVLCLLCASLLVNAGLYAKFQAPRPAAPRVVALGVGMPVPSLPVRTLAGQSMQLTFTTESQGTILYSMSPGSIWCARNAANIAAIAKAQAGQYEVVGLSSTSDGLQEFVRRHPAPFPIYVATDDTRRSLLIRAMPETLVIDKAGIVAAVYPGPYRDDISDEIETFFALRLPGLLPVTAPSLTGED